MNEQILTSHDTNQPLVVNKVTRDIYEELSSQDRIQQKQLWFITSADNVVVDCDMTSQFEQWSEEMDYILGLSAVQELSAIQQMVDGKRDYSDLTFGQSDSLVLSSELSDYVETSDFELSGLGCSTIELSGTYDDDTTFSYEFVIMENQS